MCILVSAGCGMLASHIFRATTANASANTAAQVSQPVWAPGGSHARLTVDNSVFAFVDHQTGLMNLVDNVRAVEFKNYVLGLGELARAHGMPVVLTTSAEEGPNGPKLPELVAMFPDAPLISRPGQINAWSNEEFVQAIKVTGRKNIIISGITTDVCVAFATLSALDAGYTVYVVVDASGTMSESAQNAALMRMSAAGAIIGNWFAISCELLWDWREPAGPASAELFKKYLPSYADVVHSHESRQPPAASSTAQ